MEIELKLAIDPHDLPALRRHPALAGITPVRRHLVSRYYDTPDFALTRHGIALRVRRVAGRWVQTMKAEAPVVGALASRPEWETPAAGPLPDLALLPEEARTRLHGIHPGDLHTAFVTDFWRTAWTLDRGDTRMELALDRGEIQADAAVRPLCEIEIERLEGHPVPLFDLALELLESLPLGIDPRSKAARGYALAGAVTPSPARMQTPRLGRSWEAHEVWRALQGSALTQLAANVPGFLAQPEETEYLHQLRVAARRLRALSALAPSLGHPRPDWLPALADILRALGPARDWDVLLNYRLPTVLPLFPDTDPALLAHLSATATRARQEAQARITSPAFTRLILRAGRDLIRPGPNRRNNAKDWAAALLEKRWKRLKRRAGDLARLPPCERHLARIAAKKLRYTADALAGLYPNARDRFLLRLSRLQDSLGVMQDAAMANRRLREATLPTPELAFQAGNLAGALAVAAHREEEGGAARWLELVRTEPFWRGRKSSA
ncbi:MAG: CHAD domain-containing protein [Betaproteobacteria bacterium]|nr:CHAD domain-containing protein [Betaproteobacteria bacterium]